MSTNAIITTTTTTELPYHHLPADNLNQPAPTLSQKSFLNLLSTKCTTSLQHLKQTHALALKTDHFQDHYISGWLIKAYANPSFDTLDSSLEVFHHTPRPNVFVWNSVIKGCLDNSKPCLALSLYFDMVFSDSKPNKYTYPTLFKACTLVKGVEEGAQIHGHVVKHGFMEDGYVKSAGIQMYASFGCTREARGILDYSGGDSDVICLNAMIDGYMRCGDVKAAKALFNSMIKKNVGSWNVMISGLMKHGMVEAAKEVFDEMPDRDEISWSAMIDGYNRNGCFKEALELFRIIQTENVRPKKYLLSSLVSACTKVGALDQGQWIHAYAKRNSIRSDGVLGTALLDMYANLGRLDLAWEVFETMEKKEISSWNAMIGGLAMHGRAADAIELFMKLEKENLKPDEITFVGILNACAHGGLVDLGLEYFNTMEQMNGVEPTVEHYGCVVDLLGRAGLFAEAEELIAAMPMTPSPAVWGALLAACRVHGNINLGERIGRILIDLEPENGGRYALLSNIFAKAGRWEDVEKLRVLMKQRGVKTRTGKSMIYVDGLVHEFKVGDDSHPQMKEIYSMLEKMIERLKLEGYSQKTSEVLFDINEEEKETMLWQHSEKLAIVFGLINESPGKPIRIMKNLRICEP